MMVPQPTAQYGQVDRVSLARAILRMRNCAYAGFKSKPNTAAAAPPMVVNFRKSRRVGFMLGPPSASSGLRQGRTRGTYLIELAGQPVKKCFQISWAPSCNPVGHSSALLYAQPICLFARRLEPSEDFCNSLKNYQIGKNRFLRDRMDVTSSLPPSSVIFRGCNP